MQRIPDRPPHLWPDALGVLDRVLDSGYLTPGNSPRTRPSKCPDSWQTLTIPLVDDEAGASSLGANGTTRRDKAARHRHRHKRHGFWEAKGD